MDKTTLNSRRIDVDEPAEYARKPGVKYPDITKEENLSFIQKDQDMGKEFNK